MAQGQGSKGAKIAPSIGLLWLQGQRRTSKVVLLLCPHQDLHFDTNLDNFAHLGVWKGPRGAEKGQNENPSNISIKIGIKIKVLQRT